MEDGQIWTSCMSHPASDGENKLPGNATNGSPSEVLPYLPNPKVGRYLPSYRRN